MSDQSPQDTLTQTLIQSLSQLCVAEGVILDPGILLRSGEHFRELMKWNQTHNLTRISEPHEAAAFHYFDSLLPFNYIDEKMPQWESLLDVGSGAGFPGFIAALKYPTREIILLDASRKRCSFLRNTARLLGTSNIDVRHGRIEESAQTADLVCSRATFRWGKQVRVNTGGGSRERGAQDLLDRLAGQVKPGGGLALWVGEAPSSKDWAGAVERWGFSSPKRWPYAIPLHGIPAKPLDSSPSETAATGRALAFALRQ